LFFSSEDVMFMGVVTKEGGPKDLISRTMSRPPRPRSVGHDKLVEQLHRALNEYVTPRNLGRLWAGIEVVLDRREGLALQPDIVFIVNGRESIVTDRVWGPPDMVLEVTSLQEPLKQIEERVAWFSLYGVREHWLVRPEQRELAILELAHGGVRKRMLVDEGTAITSPLLPEFNRRLSEMF
jgi:Uma2 family endonuclease